jgi:TRAP-type C4-dicarboxylate transport system permease small subunit
MRVRRGPVLSIAFAAALIFVSVLGRTFLGQSVPDDVVIAENLMPLIVTLPLAYVAARRGHIEVEVFTNFLPWRGRLALRIFGSLVGLTLFGLIAWSAFNVALSDYERGRFYEGVLRIPQWPAKAFFVVGLGLLSLRLMVNTAQDMGALVRGRAPDA